MFNIYKTNNTLGTKRSTSDANNDVEQAIDAKEVTASPFGSNKAEQASSNGLPDKKFPDKKEYPHLDIISETEVSVAAMRNWAVSALAAECEAYLYLDSQEDLERLLVSVALDEGMT